MKFVIKLFFHFCTSVNTYHDSFFNVFFGQIRKEKHGPGHYAYIIMEAKRDAFPTGIPIEIRTNTALEWGLTGLLLGKLLQKFKPTTKYNCNKITNFPPKFK